MTTPGTPASQSGAALVITLVMLTLTLMLAVSGMHAAQLDERLAGNHRAGVQAQMAAERSVSLEWTALTSQDTMKTCDEGASTYPADGSRQSVTSHPQLAFSIDYCRREAIVELVSHGYVLSGDEVVAQRDVKVRVADEDSRFLKLSPLTLPGLLGDFHPKENKYFLAYGAPREEGGRAPAVSVASAWDKSQIDFWLAAAFLSPRYRALGGVAVEKRNSILDGKNVRTFVTFLGLLKKESQVLNNKHLDKANFGTPQEPRLTYVEGDAKLKKESFQGAGVLLINGNAEFKGTPNFKGLIIVLGDYTTTKSKRPGTLKGALMVAPISSFLGFPYYRSADLLFQGEGAYRYDRQALEKAFDLLGEAGTFWNDNNVDTTSGRAGQLLSWQQLSSDRE